jgi:hypothetical protein
VDIDIQIEEATDASLKITFVGFGKPINDTSSVATIKPGKVTPYFWQIPLLWLQLLSQEK